MLKTEDWLKKAQALPVGRSDRIYHGRERRPNLLIWNKEDKWTAYCHACREGAVVEKEHVRIGIASPESKKSDLTLPNDMVPYLSLDKSTSLQLHAFLASKGMSDVMLPTWWYSCTRKRILIQTAEGWLGRDVTGNALEKWLTYNGQHYIWQNRDSKHTVLCEDAFSFFKIVWATQGSIQCNVLCALGTNTKASIMLRLLDQDYVQFMFDGDAAGYKGAGEGAHKCRGHGIRAAECCAPPGKDPKDLTGEAIRNLILGEHNA